MSLPPIGKAGWGWCGGHAHCSGTHGIVAGAVGKGSKKEARLASTGQSESSAAAVAFSSSTAAPPSSATSVATPSKALAAADMSGLSALDAASLEIQVIRLLFIHLSYSLHRLRLTHCFSAQEFKPDSSAIGEDEETKYKQHAVG